MTSIDERTPLLANGSGSSEARPISGQNRSGSTATTSKPRAGPSSPAQNRPSRIDAADIDARFRRWVDHIKKKMRSTEHADNSPLQKEPHFVVSVFGSMEEDPPLRLSKRSLHRHDGFLSDGDFARQLSGVQASIAHGLHPKMIQTGSSGSYFLRMLSDFDHQETDEADDQASLSRSLLDHEVVAVFKPNDEEPYGDLNPKRVLLRRYLWWAMGRPCLIPSFSYLSEVAASRLDSRLHLGLVPSTRLVSLASESFYYLPSERKTRNLRGKPGSYQQFLRGYVNVSAFLRAHPWPSRPRELLERDIQAENTAHGRAKARARKGRVDRPTRKRQCLSFLEPINCFKRKDRPEAFDDTNADDVAAQNTHHAAEEGFFEWTAELMDDFRQELEKLVCFDYLIRNTDRGLDNFMVRIVEPSPEGLSRKSLKLAAIDNSLAFPWTHPAGIRSYPWGWLYLPTDLIGGPFSAETRATFIAHLSSPSWWHQTRIELERLFREDAHFDAAKFEGQMDVLRGQGWNLLESLRNDDEGPLELCARDKQRVSQEDRILTEDKLLAVEGNLCPLTSLAKSLKLRGEDKVAENTHTAIDQGAGSIPVPAPNSADIRSDFRPASLPHARSIDADLSKSVDHLRQGVHQPTVGEHASHHLPITPVDGSLGKAYRSGSLGIDVLKGMDKISSRATARPALRKSKTGRSAVGRGAGIRPDVDAHPAIAEDASDTEEMESNFTNASEAQLSSSVASLRPYKHQRQSLRSYQHARQSSYGGPLSIDGILANADASGPSQGARRIRVFVEHLIADRGVAWQTWLGL